MLVTKDEVTQLHVVSLYLYILCFIFKYSEYADIVTPVFVKEDYSFEKMNRADRTDIPLKKGYISLQGDSSVEIIMITHVWLATQKNDECMSFQV